MSSPSAPLFTAYTGVVPPIDPQPSPTSPTAPASPNTSPTTTTTQHPATFDFKVMIIRAKHLYRITSNTTTTAATTASHPPLVASTPVWVQLQVLDNSGTAIAPHFRYKSTIKAGTDPEWCESVLLKHLPCKPAQLEFSFYALPSPTAEAVLLGSLVAGSELLSRYWPAVADVKSSVHSRYHRVSGGGVEADGDAQFHFVLAPAYARLRHLTAAQSKPPLLPAVKAVAAVPAAAASSSPGLPVPRRSPPQPPQTAPVRHPPPLVTNNSLSSTHITSPASSTTASAADSTSPPIPPSPTLPPLPPLPPLDTSTPTHFHSNPTALTTTTTTTNTQSSYHTHQCCR